MRRPYYFFILIFFCISSCNSKSSQTENKSSVWPAKNNSSVSVNIDSLPKQKDSIQNEQEIQQYCNIKAITQKGDSVFLDVNLVQFLTGKEAVKAAEKAGFADTSYDERGNISDISVPDDYFIANDNKKFKRLALGKNCVIELLTGGSPKPATDNSIQNLKRRYKDRLFILSLLGNDKVAKVKEVYLP